MLTDAQVSRDLAVSGGNAAAGAIQDQGDYLDQLGISPTVNTTARMGDMSANPSADAAPPTTAAPASEPRPACEFALVTGWWSCAPFTNSRGLLVTRSYQFLDATSKPMQSYSGATTARINYQTEASGAIGDGTAFTGVTHRSSKQTMSGLLGSERSRVWDGSGVSADTNTHRDSNAVRHYAGVRLDSMKAVAFTHPRPPGAYPLSGQTVQVANYAVTSTGRTTETRSVSRRVVTTYNGTALARVQAGKVECTLHLDTRKVDNCTGR